jgi:hypothetical protein
MLTIRERQMDALRTNLEADYEARLAEYLLRQHPARSSELGASAVRSLTKRVVTEARRLGMTEGRVITRIATAALLVDPEILWRPEVKALFDFFGLDADLKADLLCDQVCERMKAIGGSVF